MKRALPLLFTLITILSYSGCSGGDDDESIPKIDSYRQLLIGRWKFSSAQLDIYDAQGRLTSSENSPDFLNEIEREYEKDKVTFYVDGKLGSTGTYTLEERDGRFCLSSRTTTGEEVVELSDVTKEKLTLIFTYQATNAKLVTTEVLVPVR